MSKEPKTVFDELQKYFRFKTLEVSKYCLGIDYHPGINAWDLPCMDLGSHTYVKECLMKVSDILRKKDIWFSNCPMDHKGHNVFCTDELLGIKMYGEYQQMIWMGVWLCSIGRFDIGYVIASLSRFSSPPPRKGALWSTCQSESIHQ